MATHSTTAMHTIAIAVSCSPIRGVYPRFYINVLPGSFFFFPPSVNAFMKSGP